MYAKSAGTIAGIMEAAQRLFTAKNFNDVTMAEIADATDVTKGALYHHFASKDDLYLTMLHSYLDGIKALTGEAVAKAGSARDRLRLLTLTFLRLPQEQQNLMKLVRRDINIFEDPARESLIRAYQSALPDQVERILRDGMADGELSVGDARILAWEHVAMVEVVLAPYARAVLGTAENTADFVLGLFFDGAAQRH